MIPLTIENRIHQYLSNQLREQGCPVRIINGMPDHIHCLFLLNPRKSIANVIKQVKGRSSHFVNQSNLIPKKFAWQTGYENEKNRSIYQKRERWKGIMGKFILGEDR